MSEILPSIRSLICDLKSIEDGTCACPKGVMRVLLVEDDYNDELLMRRTLEECGCVVDVATNGRMALHRIQEDPNRYCVMFLDIGLPVIDGISVLIETRKITKSIHIVIVTGGNRLIEIPEDSYFAVIRKPLNDNLVIEIMNKTARSGKK